MSDALWIDLEGAVNVRDLGGLAADGGTIRPGRLIRSDNLQGLTAADLRTLVDEHGVRAVADLRTAVEVTSEGPGPMTTESSVRIVHLSLLPEAGENTDVVAAEQIAQVVASTTDDEVPAPRTESDAAPGRPLLPWEQRERTHGKMTVPQTYRRYLIDRPDSVIEALRLIANTDGATIVHCAAGKDRTGVVVALALRAVGVEPEAVVADYALTAERIHLILARLGMSETYAGDLEGRAQRLGPRAQNMEAFLVALDDDFGGVPGWLRTHGWTDEDQAALQAALVA
jgi:protein tyrosine/serine phosphatase